MNALIDISFWWIGIITYTICHLTHILWWRHGTRMRNLQGMCGIFFGVPAILIVLAMFVSTPSFTWICPILVHSVLSANCVIFYPIPQVPSPSAVLLNLLRTHPQGMTKTELLKALGTAALVGDRFDDLIRGKFIRVDSGAIRLTKFGEAFAAMIVTYRKFLGLPPGAG